MSLADRQRPTPKRPGREHRVDELRRTMTAEEAALMDEYLHDAELSAGVVAGELSDAGYPISEGAVAGYRSKVLGVGRRRR